MRTFKFLLCLLALAVWPFLGRSQYCNIQNQGSGSTTFTWYWCQGANAGNFKSDYIEQGSGTDDAGGTSSESGLSWGYPFEMYVVWNESGTQGTNSCSWNAGSGNTLVGTVTIGVASTCTTNVSTNLFDLYNQTIIVTGYTAQGAYANTWSYNGPLSNTVLSLAVTPCTNWPYSFIYSNVPSACTTNGVLNLYNSYTNEILCLFTNYNGQSAGSETLQGPLNGYEQDFPDVPCTNWPYSVTYSNIPPCLHTNIFDVQNTATAWRIFCVVDTSSGSGQEVDPQFVGPGAYYYESNVVNCANAPYWHLFTTAPGGGDEVQDTGIGATGQGGGGTNNAPLGGGGQGVNNDGSGAGDTNSNSNAGNSQSVTNIPPPPSNANPNLPVQPAVTNNIVWQNTNQALGQLSQDVQNSGQAIYNGINTAANQAHSDAGGIDSQSASNAAYIASSIGNLVTNTVAAANGVIASVNSNALSTATGLSNLVGQVNGIGVQVAQGEGGVQGAVTAAANTISNALHNVATNDSSLNLTNYALETTQDRVLTTNSALAGTEYGTSNTMVGISNLISGFFTNTSDTNVYYVTNAPGLQASDTNYSAAEAFANSLMDFTGINALLADLSPTLPPASVSPVDMTMSFCGQVMDFDPVHMFPAAQQVSYLGLKVVALLAFFIRGWSALLASCGGQSNRANRWRACSWWQR